MNNIYIEGEITSNTPYGLKVELIAGNEVIVEDEAHLSLEVDEFNPTPEYFLFIEPSLDFSHPMPQVDQQYVASFCGSINNASDYKANAISKNLIINQNYFNDHENINNSENSFFEFNVYPNPSSGKFNVKVTDRSSNIKISIYDMLGREVKFKKSDLGQNEFFIEFLEPSTGMYNIQVIGDNGQETKRILVK